MSDHEIHWDTKSASLVLIHNHDMTKESNHGWLGTSLTDTERATLLNAWISSGLAPLEQHSLGEMFDDIDDYLNCNGPTPIGDEWYGRSDEVYRITSWCGLSEAQDWVSLEEHMSCAKWDGPHGTIPICAVIDHDFDEGPCINVIGPIA